MTPLLKYLLLGLLLVSSAIGCDPYYRHGYYGRDRSEAPAYGSGWGRQRYEQQGGSYDTHGEYRGRHQHEDDD
jgi:hypothetical protein